MNILLKDCGKKDAEIIYTKGKLMDFEKDFPESVSYSHSNNYSEM